MLIAVLGWKLAALYVVSGLAVAIVGGVLIGRMGLENQVEEYVYQTRMGTAEAAEMTWRERINYAWDDVKDIVGRIWIYVLIGIGVGAAIHGYAPEDLLTRWAGPGNPFAVPIAVLLGIPLYSNAVGTIPVVQALLGKGVAVGTALAFMMSITALSFPEMIILRKVLKPRLIAIFIAVVGLAIIFTGYLFNAVGWRFLH
ncbi:Predicted permease [Desulfoscipio geothermicus DSM 3669]|uniref:Predicted permease n=1 Tax=Desulfoscipio geothermicus DSM 3669 TaxID=1121426 RepID=A0A1I6E0A3_9FIRM|nr:Predicted permease [Desulfoscipio geothermicus DSM 3669]